jgi:Zn-finger nucleic acid-binding protein
MKCPHCHTTDLAPTMIEEFLPAMGCGTCHGALVSLLYYRHWAEEQKEPAAEPARAAPTVETTDTTEAITCTKCSRVMTKYKISGAVTNRVDVCSTCDDAWLDGGEWELLEQLQLSDKLPAVFTDTWQRKLRQEGSDRMRQDLLRKTIGDADANKVESLRTWLNEHPAKSAILTYLYRQP